MVNHYQTIIWQNMFLELFPSAFSCRKSNPETRVFQALLRDKQVTNNPLIKARGGFDSEIRWFTRDF